MSRSSRKARSPLARRLMDALIDDWLENSPAGQAMLAKVTKAEARASLYELQRDGLVAFVVNTEDRPGHIGFRVEILRAGWESLSWN